MKTIHSVFLATMMVGLPIATQGQKPEDWPESQTLKDPAIADFPTSQPSRLITAHDDNKYELLNRYTTQHLKQEHAPPQIEERAFSYSGRIIVF